MSTRTAITAGRIFDGQRSHENAALLVDGDRCAGIVAADAIPAGYEVLAANGAMLVPGFVDLQVNGGGGVQFNDALTADAIATICAAHARFGTTSIMVTLITDTPEVTAHAIEAGAQAADTGIAGFAGLHLEGPHLSLARKGAHDPALIRPMTDTDVAALVAARRRLPALMTTVAPESVTPDQVRALTGAGIAVSLGHSDTDCATAQRYAEAGARMVTHLFNAMSPLTHREPGMVGAALDTSALSAGLIADGIHVDPVAIRIALAAKRGPGHVFLVTDAMAPLGTDMRDFELNGRTIHRDGNRLTLDDGTLAGADIDMAASVRFLVNEVGVDRDEALRMATAWPAQALGIAAEKGMLGTGAAADFAVLDDDLSVTSTWIGGRPVFSR